MKKLLFTLLGLWVALAPATGCSPGANSFIRDDVDFSYIRTVAVYPFANLTQDAHASQRLHSIFISEVLDADAVEIRELGETLQAMGDLRLNPDGELTTDQVVALGKNLGVDAVFFGTIEDYGIERVSDGRTYSVTATFRLRETETGTMIWNAQTRADGASVWRKIFGGGSASLYDVSREAVHQALETLF